MKRFGIVTLVMGLCMGLCLGFSSPVRASSAGANYIGDADGDGMIGIPDLGAINLKLNGKPYNYGNVKPPTGETQDLDGDCFLGIPDKGTIQSWLNGKWALPGGHPDTVVPMDMLTGNTLVGSITIDPASTDIAVIAKDNSIGNPKSGWGVSFRVQTGAGLCSGALIEALNGSTIESSGPEGFDYTMEGCMVGGNGYAIVKVLRGTCQDGDSVVIYPWVKKDSDSGALGARLPNDILPSGSIRGMVGTGVLPCDLDTLTISGPTNLLENAIGVYTATCTYVGLGCSIFSDDCTQAGGVAWDAPGGDLTLVSSDPLSITVQANDIPCGAGGNGTVSGSASYGAGSDTDLFNVIVDNDDTPDSLAVDTASCTEGEAAVGYAALTTYTDGCTEDTTTLTTASDDCTGGAGSVDCGQIPCSPGGTCTITGTGGSDDIIVNNDDTKSSVVVLPNPLNGNGSSAGSQDFYAYLVWSDSCTEPDDVGGWSVAGTCTGTAVNNNGNYTWPVQSADCQDTVTKTDLPASGFAIANLSLGQCNIATFDLIPVASVYGGTIDLIEGAVQAFICACTYTESQAGACGGVLSDNCTRAGASLVWNVSGNLIDLGNGLVQAPQDSCGGEPADGQVSALVTFNLDNGSDSTNVNVTNDDDACGSSPEGEVELPADDSLHSSEKVEWWYWTGHLKTDDGRWFGFEQVFFTVGVPFVGRYRMVHHAITDIQEGEFHYTSNYASGSWLYVEDGFELALGAQTAEGGDGHDFIHGKVDNYVLDLELNSVKAPVLQFGDGYQYFPQLGVYTYYYSRERMEAAGTLTIDGETLPVTGSAWFDHQWGSHNNQMIDWDWFAIQLDDNREVMISIIRDSGGPIVGGSFTDQNCITTEIDPADLAITALGSWTSPHSGGVYPMGWDISISGDECREDLNFTVTPVMEDQELSVSASSYTFNYWEGAAVVSGDVEGRAYIELNGYGGSGCSMSPSPVPPMIGLVNWIFLLVSAKILGGLLRFWARRS